MISILLGLFLLGMSPPQATDSVAGAHIERWHDIHGARVDPFVKGPNKARVLVFVMTDCPIANGYAPEINRIVEEYRARGVDFSIVYVDPPARAAQVPKHVREYGYHCTAILDPSQTLAKRAGATITPQAVVLVGAKIVYRGRIDDRVIDFGKIRHTVQHQDLRLTLDAILRGEAPPVSSTPCTGCYIPTGGKRH